MKLRLTAGVLLALLWVGPGASANPNPYDPSLATLGGPPASGGLNGLGLLNSDRIHFAHALSFSYASNSQESVGYGLWQGRLSYKLSNPLRVSVDVGAVLNPMGGGPMLSQESIFLGGFNLEYQPSRNFKINISYVNTPPSARLPGRYAYTGFPGWSDPGFGR